MSRILNSCSRKPLMPKSPSGPPAVNLRSKVGNEFPDTLAYLNGGIDVRAFPDIEL